MTDASAAASTGSVSPAGDALATLPPRVPRFWIWTPPTSRAAAASIGSHRRTSGELIRSRWVANAPIASMSPRTSMVRSRSSPHRFRKRMSFNVPKLSDTKRSVHPAIGTSGPSSRSIFNASGSDRGWSRVRVEIAPSIRRNRGERRERGDTSSFRKVVDLPHDAVAAQVLDVEIQDQAEVQARELQIGDDLRLVYAIESR